MSPFLIGIIGVALLLVLFAAGMPISFAMALAGIVCFGFTVTPVAAMGLVALEVFEQFSSYPLSAIPMFILMGGLALAAGIGKKLYEVAYVTMGQLRGGLCIASIAACTLFGAVCGSSSATCATIGRTAIPEMRKYGYSDVLATGTIAAAGGLGILIPPSGTFILYGLLTENSIGKLFIAGILPGILMSILLMITVSFICWRNPQSGPAATPTTLKQKAKALVGLTDTVLLFLLSMGGMFAGWFSPTQAGAIGGAGAIIIGLARRELTWHGFIDAVRESARIGCMVLLLIAGAMLFGRFLAVSKLSYAMLTAIGSWSIPPLLTIGIICLIFIVLGCFVDMAALIVLFVPLFYPLVVELGFDPIWFGVIIVVLGIIGIVTPPVGVNAYVVKGLVPDLPLEVVFKGVMPFLIPLIVSLIILMIFPRISTFLPSLLPY